MIQRLRLDFLSETAPLAQSFDVPDITTALVVADINMQQGQAQLRAGDRLVATLERQPCEGATYWRVS
jgi:hypothetical protein